MGYGVQSHVGLKLAIGPLYAAAVLTLCAILVVRFRARPTPAEGGVAVVNVGFAVSQVVAVTPVLVAGSSPEAGAIAFYSATNFLLMPAAYTGMGMFTVFILASDLSEEMKAIAVRDQLTGVLNRRGLAEATRRLFAHSKRLSQPLSVLLADIDRFKEINDQFGHAAGDKALLRFSQLLAGDRRAQDVVARIGGEEFVLVLPSMHAQEAAQFAELLRQRAEGVRVSTERGEIRLTASFGVASRSVEDQGFEDVLKRADEALYRCKKGGRNCVYMELSGPACHRGQEHLAAVS